MKALKTLTLSLVLALASTASLADEICVANSEVAKYIMYDRQYRGDPIEDLEQNTRLTDSMLDDAKDETEIDIINNLDAMKIELIRSAYKNYNKRYNDKDREEAVKDFKAKYYTSCMIN